MVLHPKFKFTENHHQDYLAHGYHIFQHFLDEKSLRKAQEMVDRILYNMASTMDPEWIMNVHLLGEKWLYDLASDERLLDSLKMICGPKIVLAQTHIFCKPSLPQIETPWHQDGRSPKDIPMATIWITLDDLPPENIKSCGSLKVLPGQHRQGILKSIPGKTFQFENIIPLSYVEKHEVKSYVMCAGQAAMHHPWLPHASQSNKSGKMRRVIVLRYLNADHMKSEGVLLWKVAEQSTEKALSLVAESYIHSIDQDGDDIELYPDYRFNDRFFEGKCILLN